MKYLLFFLLPFSLVANTATDTTLKALSELETPKAIRKNLEKKALKYELDKLAPLMLLYKKQVKLNNMVVDLDRKSVSIHWSF